MEKHPSYSNAMPESLRRKANEHGIDLDRPLGDKALSQNEVLERHERRHRALSNSAPGGGPIQIDPPIGQQRYEEREKLADDHPILAASRVGRYSRPAPTGTEAQVCRDIAERQVQGIDKYGTTVAENPLPLRDWLQHAYEETLDQAVYLRRAIEELSQPSKIIFGAGTSHMRHGWSIRDYFASREEAQRLAIHLDATLTTKWENEDGAKVEEQQVFQTFEDWLAAQPPPEVQSSPISDH